MFLTFCERKKLESDTFDLAGQATTTIETNIQNAFQEPFQLNDMIRITFITGAGKLGRQKYDDNATRTVTTTLRQLGFVDDRGASCVKECAGSFKLQHDTGKNLKTVVVFPKLVQTTTSDDDNVTTTAGPGDATTNNNAAGAILTPGSPQESIVMSSKTVFERMIKSQCPAWSQKKGCLVELGTIKTILTNLEQKLMNGTPLTENEQTFYDSVSMSSLEEKQTYVKDLMHSQVDTEMITQQEKMMLLGQVSERIQTVKKELETAETEKKAQKIQKFNGMVEKLTTRQTKLHGITPKEPHRLKHEAEITKLRIELEPLLQLGEGAKGRLLSIKETQSLSRRDDILEEIAALEVRKNCICFSCQIAMSLGTSLGICSLNWHFGIKFVCVVPPKAKSRGWFEDDESFAVRVAACEATWQARSKQRQRTTKKTTTSSSSSNTNAWMTTSTSRPQGSRGYAKAAGTKKKSTSSGAGVFGAMMADSDSD